MVYKLRSKVCPWPEVRLKAGDREVCAKNCSRVARARAELWLGGMIGSEVETEIGAQQARHKSTPKAKVATNCTFSSRNKVVFSLLQRK